MQETSNKFGTRVRELRRMRRMSMEALSEAADISKNTISRIEANKNNTTVETAAKIANALGVTLSDIFEGI